MIQNRLTKILYLFHPFDLDATSLRGKDSNQEQPQFGGQDVYTANHNSVHPRQVISQSISMMKIALAVLVGGFSATWSSGEMKQNTAFFGTYK